MWHVYGREEICVQDFRWGDLRERPLGRPRLIWDDNIKIDLQEMGWGNIDWIALVPNRDRWRALVNTVMNLQVP